MAKIRLTKNELKAQRDALRRFERYLPTLQLKKQQLQMEVRRRQDELDRLREEERRARDQVGRWVRLFAHEDAALLDRIVRVREWRTAVRNVAGVDTPVFLDVDFEVETPDLFVTPWWLDDGIEAVKNLVRFELQRRLLEEQLDALRAELRITTQRVNLFEKVKIPEARENIRRIRIYLGDQQTAAVGRAKIAKRKTQARRASPQAAEG